MTFRVATLNKEQDHKRWPERRELIIEQLGEIRPDVLALNEVCIPLQSARWIQRQARERLGIEYALVQQTKTNGSSLADGEAILTRFPMVFIDTRLPLGRLIALGVQFLSGVVFVRFWFALFGIVLLLGVTFAFEARAGIENVHQGGFETPVLCFVAE